MDGFRLPLAASLLLAASSAAAAPVQLANDDVVARISTLVAQAMDYPREAKPLEEQGIAVVGFTVAGAGTAEAIALVRSSGHAMLDDAALRTIARLRGLPTEAVGRRTFAVLQYRLTAPGRDPEGARSLQIAIGTLQQR